MTFMQMYLFLNNTKMKHCGKVIFLRFHIFGVFLSRDTDKLVPVYFYRDICITNNLGRERDCLLYVQMLIIKCKNLDSLSSGFLSFNAVAFVGVPLAFSSPWVEGAQRTGTENAGVLQLRWLWVIKCSVPETTVSCLTPVCMKMQQANLLSCK